MPSIPRAAFLNVTDPPFNADPTGTYDSTQAFQAALNAAGNLSVALDERQSNIVFAPAGIYKIDGPITIPAWVTLEGTWDTPPDCGANFPSPNQAVGARNWWNPQIYSPFLKGTTLVTDYGRGIDDRSDLPAFITLAGPSSTLKGVWIFYPRQGFSAKRHRSFSVIPYQWTIRAVGDSCTVSGVLLQNSYSGIDFSHFGGRHILKHIWGQPLREGIRIANCFDVGRILDVHFWPFWDHGADRKREDPSVDTVFRDFISQNGFALTLFKSDMQIVHDFFAFGYFVGVHLGFQRIPADESQPQVAWGACTGQFTNLNLDQCTNGIDFHSTDKSGIQLTNANIVCRDLPCVNDTIIENPKLAHHAIVGHYYADAREHQKFALPEGFLAIRGASFFGYTLDSMVAWESSNNTLMISSSWFKNEADPANDKCKLVDAALVDLGRGRGIIQGNWFQRYNGGDAVRIGTDCEAAIITGNISEGHAYPVPSGPSRIVSDNILLP